MGFKDKLDLKKKGKQDASLTPASVPDAKQDSTQQWFPIRDIDHNLIYRKDHYILAAIRVLPININLLSEKEKKRKVKQLEEVLNGIDYHIQIFSIAKPVDLDSYINELEEKRKNAENRIQAKLLNGYIQQAAIKATSGEALERQFYFIIEQVLGKKQGQDAQNLINLATSLASSLTTAELKSHMCSDQELRDLQFIFNNPHQSAYERSPITNKALPPILFAQEDYK